jgi:hypothetical protein
MARGLPTWVQRGIEEAVGLDVPDRSTGAERVAEDRRKLGRRRPRRQDSSFRLGERFVEGGVRAADALCRHCICVKRHLEVCGRGREGLADRYDTPYRETPFSSQLLSS